MDFQKLLYDNGEIEFDYNQKHYFTSCYFTRRLFKKGKVEYWFIDEKNELHKFSTLEKLMEVELNGEKLKNILDKIEITYP